MKRMIFLAILCGGVLANAFENRCAIQKGQISGPIYNGSVFYRAFINVETDSRAGAKWGVLGQRTYSTLGEAVDLIMETPMCDQDPSSLPRLLSSIPGK